MDILSVQTKYQKNRCLICHIYLSTKKCANKSCNKMHGYPSSEYPKEFCRSCVKEYDKLHETALEEKLKLEAERVKKIKLNKILEKELELAREKARLQREATAKIFNKDLNN